MIGRYIILCEFSASLDSRHPAFRQTAPLYAYMALLSRCPQGMWDESKPILYRAAHPPLSVLPRHSVVAAAPPSEVLRARLSRGRLRVPRPRPHRGDGSADALQEAARRPDGESRDALAGAH